MVPPQPSPGEPNAGLGAQRLVSRRVRIDRDVRVLARVQHLTGGIVREHQHQVAQDGRRRGLGGGGGEAVAAEAVRSGGAEERRNGGGEERMR